MDDSTFRLPAGLYGVDVSSMSSWEDYITHTPEPNKETPKCECGTTITLGNADDPQFHSTWCEVYKQLKSNG